MQFAHKENTYHHGYPPLFFNYPAASIKYHLFSILLVAVIGLTFIGTNAYFIATDIDKQWQTYQSQITNRLELLEEISGHIGFGGAIHHFKNYILRKENTSLKKFDESYQRLLHAIERYERISNISEEEKRNLATIAEIFEAYYKLRIYVIEIMVDANIASEIIDQEVKINDIPALQAMEKLKKHFEILSREQTHQLQTTLRNGQSTIIIVIFSTLFLSFLLITWIIRHITQSLQQAVVIANNIALGRLNTPFDPEKLNEKNQDEICQLMRAMHKMQTQLYERQESDKRNTRLLRQQQETLNRIIENAPYAIFAKNIVNDYRFSIWNKKAEELLGISANFILNKTDYDLFPKENADYFRQMDLKVISDEILVDIEQEQVNTPRGTIIAHTIKLPLYDEEGKPDLLLGFLDDITLKVQQAAELERAKESAEIANRAKSTFLANMSHELRTPLNGILGYTQILLLDEKLTEKQIQGINTIQRSGEYLLTLINDVLDLAKIEAERVELYCSDFDLECFLHGIIEIFEIRAQQKHVQFTYEKNSPLPKMIHADEKRLRQILLNLLSNAVKFSKGKVFLRVHFAEQQIHFEVEDNGIGIAPEDLAEIFKPFKQVGDQRYRAEGTGLGLSITQQLVRMMGGHIEVTSELGKGCRFWFNLNFVEGKCCNTPTNKAKTQKIIGYEGNQRIILIVDPHLESRSIITTFLEPLNFKVLEAATLTEALIIAEQNYLDAVLTETFEDFIIVHKLKKLPHLSSTPFIAISANVFDFHQMASMTAGCIDFLPKPLKLPQLLDYIGKNLNLNWVYGDPMLAKAKDSLKKEASNNKQVAEDVLRQLPLPRFEKLEELVFMGDILSLREYCKKSQMEYPDFSVLFKRIEDLADNFELDAIELLLSQYPKK